MEEIVKYDINGNVVELTKSEYEDLTKWETLAQEAVKEAIHDLHKKQIDSVHSDAKGIYETRGDGNKKYHTL